jgi:hypothetical protein
MKERVFQIGGKKAYMHTLYHVYSKKTHVCINDMVSTRGRRMGQTWSNTKAKATQSKKRRRKELIVVVHKVGIIEASSSSGGAKLVSPKFLLG